MRTKTYLGILAAAVLIAAYPFASWIIGIIVENHLGEREQLALKQATPYLSIIERRYRRTIYTATEVVTYRLSAPFLGPLQKTSDAAASGSFTVTVRNTIHHGPFPALGAFGLATVDTEIVLPPEAQKRIDALLGGKQLLTIRTELGWLGGQKGEITSPVFQAEVSPGTTLSSRGIVGTAITSGDLKSIRGDLTAPGFGIRDQKNAAELESLHLTAHLETAFETLKVGDIDASLGRFDVHFEPSDGGAAQTFSAHDIQFHSKTLASGEYLDSHGDAQISAFQSTKFSATRLGYTFAATHLYGRSYAALSESIRVAARDATQSQQKMADALRKDGVDLLLHDPVFEISHLGFVTPDGEFKLSAKLTLTGLKRADFESEGQAMVATVMQHLHVTADLRVDTGLLDKLSEGNPNADRLAAQSRELQAHGFITQDGHALSTHFVFDHGNLTLNGQPFPPTPQR